MSELTLNAEEKELLETVLESYISNLRMEIADTDNFDFRQDLKKKEASLKEIQSRLASL